MKIFGLFFLYLLCAGLLFEAHAQIVVPGNPRACDRFRPAVEQPVECWIELLGSRDPGTRLLAAENLARMGPRAEAAVPALARMIGETEASVKEKVFEALVQIAEGCDSCPAVKVLHDILDRSTNFIERLYSRQGLARIYKTGLTGVWQLPGWPGVFPQASFSGPGLTRPLVSDNGKKYSQSFTSGEAGQIFEYTKTETLARDPDFARRYADETLKKEADPPFVGAVGKRKVLVWNLKTTENAEKNECLAGRSRIVVILAYDKTWTLEVCDNSTFRSLENPKPAAPDPDVLIKFFLNDLSTYFDRLEAALENPPRTDFRRNFELFKTLKKGMSVTEVVDYVGYTDDFYFAGEGITLAVYELIDESKIILKFTLADKTINFFSHDRPWKLESATRRTQNSQPPETFIK
jgi:hypothetical protein